VEAAVVAGAVVPVVLGELQAVGKNHLALPQNAVLPDPLDVVAVWVYNLALPVEVTFGELPNVLAAVREGILAAAVRPPLDSVAFVPAFDEIFHNYKFLI